jgi:hypothetical protein
MVYDFQPRPHNDIMYVRRAQPPTPCRACECVAKRMSL